ncbi:putative competence-damage inducible protein [Candidatus Vecturithrix granuli]|uniref:CinA-like protein n=1 Tax=Vecturithrix granuli TaxID=1499967 RepID=A0A081BUE3_VECG1|nr:putative competence-damage inducible protein [Candidatus Vecturithrix granuli]
MNAEIVVIGTELLLGQIIDTNAAYMAEELNKIGVGVLYKSTVGDNAGRMREVLSRALERADVVITSGGLGPTEDDLTRQIAAQVTGRQLVLHPELLAQIQQIFAQRQMPFTENNIQQAYIPEGALPIENPQGTAPGYIIEAEQGILISLPGVPREMKYLMQTAVLPYLRKKLGKFQIITSRVLKLCGIGESTVDYAIRDLIQTSSNPTIGLLAHLGQIDIRITAKADSADEAAQRIGELEAKVRERLAGQIFGADHETQESVLVRLLQEHQLSLAVAETNTGGRISQRLTGVPGIDAVFRGGVVLTDRASYQRLLSLSEDAFESHDLISLETAKRLAYMVKDCCGATLGLGIAGYRQSRDGQIIDPAVPSFLAIHMTEGEYITKDYYISGPAELVQTRVTTIALEMLRRAILGLEKS